jgi:two-component system cell cycle response regulator
MTGDYLDTTGLTHPPLRVLAADDDRVSRAVLVAMLEELGHECYEAPDGRAGWELVREQRPDVVVSDWLMPGGDGLDLCRRVREHEGPEALPYVYFILLTALDDRRHILAGMRAGVDDYLTKPVQIDALQARLIAASRVTRLHRQLRERHRQLEELNRELEHTARTDPLTGLGNRLRLGEDLRALEDRRRRYGRPFALAVLDLDRFKDYNDTWGHLAGDDALRALAGVVRDAMRAADLAYRYGGEEFLLVFPEQGAEEAAVAVERIRHDLEGLGLAHPRSDGGVMTVSAGVADVRDGGDGVAEALRRADAALYRAKAEGRNRVAVDGPCPALRP